MSTGTTISAPASFRGTAEFRPPTARRGTDLAPAVRRAGADIILTNTFGCNPSASSCTTLKTYYELANAPPSSRKVADASDRPIVVQFVGPTGSFRANGHAYT